jgi:hypothetical protein
MYTLAGFDLTTYSFEVRDDATRPPYLYPGGIRSFSFHSKAADFFWKKNAEERLFLKVRAGR